MEDRAQRDHIRSYRDLHVWKAAVDLAVACYALTKPFPANESYGMVTQIRRCAASIAANIAEGHGRESTPSFVKFLRIAQGSTKELETHLIIVGRVGLVPEAQIDRMLARTEEVGKMIRSLQRR